MVWLIERDALSPLFFSFSLEYAIRKVLQNKEGLESNGTHQLLARADAVNLCENINIAEKNTEALLDASKQIGLDVNEEKTKHKFMSCHKIIGQNRYEEVTNSLKIWQSSNIWE
jgi:hypothetical protein